MALGRHSTIPATGMRDIEGDYIQALLEEYEALHRCGLADRAADVATQLELRGHRVHPPKPLAGTKERAVTPEGLERAIDDGPPRRRPGRPKKAE